MEQSYRSTIAIYKSILEQFNPALEKLIYLGSKYIRAFHALSEAADVYFTAVQKIGEQALQSPASQVLGEILIQMSDTQMHLNCNLKAVSTGNNLEALNSLDIFNGVKAQTFHIDLLQHMEKNTKLDVQFINDSRQRYEKEYRRRVTILDKCVLDLRRMERNRDKNAWEMKANVMRLHDEVQGFITESQQAAELEEKRRYRFLAEKHQLLSNTFLQFYTNAQALILNKSPQWKESLEASHNPVQNWLTTPHSQVPSSGRLTPTHLEKSRRPLSDFGPVVVGRSSSPFFQGTPQGLSSFQPEMGRNTTPRILSGGPASPGQRSRSSSFSEQVAQRTEAGCMEGNAHSLLKVRTVMPHLAGSNPTLLQFSAGDVVTVLIGEAQNGWLYGKLEGTSRSGWFPEAFVKSFEESTPRSFPLRNSQSMDNLLGQPRVPSPTDHQKSSRPQSPIPSPVLAGVGSPWNSLPNAATPSTDSKKLAGWDPPPELFPRGTNPFATVKLRPTVTNDRSAPVIR